MVCCVCVWSIMTCKWGVICSMTYNQQGMAGWEFCPRTHKEFVTDGDVVHTRRDTAIRKKRLEWHGHKSRMPAVQGGSKSSPLPPRVSSKNCVQKMCWQAHKLYCTPRSQSTDSTITFTLEGRRFSWNCLAMCVSVALRHADSFISDPT